MKFNQYLEQNAVEEWRRAYINYRGLKKLLKRVAAHHRQRLELLAQEYGAESPRNEASTSATKPPTKESFAALRERIARAQEAAGSSSDLAASPRPPHEIDAITLNGTGLSLSSASQAKLRPSGNGSDGNDGDVEQGVAASSLSALTAASASHHRKKNKKHRQPTQLDEYLSTLFDPSEQLFFHVLDSELERITDFYEKELAEAQTRFNALAQQLNELAEHRRLYKESRVKGADSFDWKGVLKGKGPSNGEQQQPQRRRTSHLDDARRGNGSSQDTAVEGRGEGIEGVKSVSSSDEDQGAKRRSMALEGMHRLAPHRGDEVPEGHASLVRHPERYKAARHKLKDAIAESYRGLELLRTYASVLNKTGFAKILKKFDKNLETQTSQRYWKARIEPSPLAKSKAIDDLIRSTEDAFATFFEHGDRKRALERLRAQGQVASALRTHHGAASRTGFFLGITLCAIVGGLVEAMKPERQQSIPSYQALLRVYGALFLPVLFLILWGVNLAVFAQARVSTLFIFEWNPRTALDYHEYPELPSFLLLLLGVAFWVSFVNPFPSAIAPTTWPLVWLVVALVILILPLPIFHLRSRTWFIRSILRVFGAGFFIHAVEFRDFFLGDELNSIAWSISTLWFMGCEYQRKWHEPQCEPNGTYWTAVLSSLPAILRLAQCLRRFTDSNFYARVHLLNAIKYSTTVLFYFTYINWRKGGSLALWVVFACLYSSSTMSWDILMDWSLLHPHAKYPFLRDELLFESSWPVYYWAIFSNIILRCSWIIYLLPGPASTLTRTFLIALLEMLRRWQWNFFRIANEHQQNVDQYRALRDTPLPYTVPKARADDEGSDDGHEEQSNVAVRLRTWGRAMRPGRKPKQTDESTTSQTPPAQRPAQPAAQPSTASTFMERVQTFLVPDHGGWAARGHRLDEEAVVTGSMGRDYAPRPREAAADSDSDEGGSETNDAESEMTDERTTSGDEERMRSADV